jgi:hypothetical protein
MRLLLDQRNKIERSLSLVAQAEQLVAGSGLPADTQRIELGLALSKAKAILESFLDRR